MRIHLMLNAQTVGYMDYEILNWDDNLGQLGAIHTAPPQIGQKILQSIRTNRYAVTVSGGDIPPNVESYWDGIVATLNQIKEDVRGFEYLVPAGQDPLKDDTKPRHKQERIR